MSLLAFAIASLSFLSHERFRERELATIALAIATNSERAPLPAPYDTAERTAALLVAVSFYETHHQTTPPPAADHLPTYCLYQVSPAAAHDTAEHLRNDLDACTRGALRALAYSIEHSPRSHPLAVYTSGQPGRGWRASDMRTELAERLLRRYPTEGCALPSH